ncbi:MAG: mechanosensitive ion channel [Gammaproteobacteria bacterium]|nr:mechanosensitive ion channel [Gammaproteobacteria bacterium]
MFEQIINYSWHDNLEYISLTVFLISFYLYRSKPSAHSTIKNTFLVYLLSITGLFMAGFVATTQQANLAQSLYTAFFIIEGMAVIRLFGLLIFNSIFPALSINPPSILEEIIVIIAYFIWGMIQLHFAGLNLGEIITTSAILTAVLAFAMQDTLGNTFGGLALQWDHSLKVGDWIRINDIEGKIVDISWRAIHIETRDWETVIMPNSILMKNQFKVIGKRIGEPKQWRRWIWFNIEYSISPSKVIKVAEKAMETAEIANIASVPKPNCLMMDYNDSVARYALRYWLTDFAVDAPVDSQVREHLYFALKREGLMPSIPQQHLFITKENEKHQNHHLKLELDHRYNVLKQIDLFKTFDEKILHDIAKTMTFLPFAKNDIVTRQGEIDHSLKIIISGQAELIINHKGQTEHMLDFEKGDFFGEMGLMTGKPRSGSIKAVTDLECYTLNKHSFEEIVQANPHLIEVMYEAMKNRKDALDHAFHKIDEEEKLKYEHYHKHEMLNHIKQFFGLT